jgi:phosphoribosylformylglycinamidine synthase I
MSRPRAAVIVFPGSNGDRDLLEALQGAGFDAFPTGISLAGLPGGFAFGDYWRAGMLASRERAVTDLPELASSGGLVIGICNGFQILVEAGLLPGALSYNDPAGFRHRWVTVRRTEVEGPWLEHLAPGSELRLPIAHGEGAYFHPEGAAALSGRVPFVYGDNPNGSIGDIAALLDETGRVLGIMPHPERASHPALGSDDGLALFTGAREWIEATRPAVPA